MYYQIVPMDRSHIEQIARLEQACFSSPWTENMLADALFDTQASFKAAHAKPGTVGWLCRAARGKHCRYHGALLRHESQN